MNLLLVDDIQENTSVLKLLVEEWFEDNNILEYLNIDTAFDGEIALDMIAEKKYDIVFMDIMMPNMDGISALKAIRLLSLECQPIVIMVTALMDKKTKNNSKEAGANAYVTKPVKYNMITGVLNKYICKEFVIQNDKPCLIAPDSNFSQFNSKDEIISAKEFLQDIDNTEYLLDEIEHLHHILEIFRYNLNHNNINRYLNSILKTLHAFENILFSFTYFDTSLYLLRELQEDLNRFDFFNACENRLQNIHDALYPILIDIDNWTQNTFISQELDNILYINETIYNDCKKLEVLKND